MKKIILDTNIIIKYPKLLGIKIPETVLVITTAVMEELVLKTKFNDELSELIDQANRAGNVEIVGSNAPDIRAYESMVPTFGLAGADQNLLATALYYRGLGVNVSLSSNDKYIQIHANTFNFPLVDDQHIQELVKAGEKVSGSTDLGKKIESFESRAIKRFVRQFIVPVSIGFIAKFLSEYGERLYDTINIWGTIAFFVLIGIALFVVREKWRLGYGLTEFFFGVFSIIFLFWPAFDYHKVKELDIDIKLVAGLYVMVRGQDNIVRALKGTKPGVFLAERLKIGL